jgi:hypothetical protein
VAREGSESEPNAGGSAEKGNSKQQVVRREIKQLPRVPDHSEGIEGQTLGQRKRGDRREAEERCAEGEYGGEAGTQAILKQGQKAAARAIAEQGDADRHVGEVVPLDDREEARQENLVGQRAGGNEADGGWRDARADVPLLVVPCDLRRQASISCRKGSP